MEKYGHGKYILELGFSDSGVYNYKTDSLDRDLDILKPYLEDHMMFSFHNGDVDENEDFAELVIEFSVTYYKIPATYYDPPEEGFETKLDRAYLLVDGQEVKLPDNVAQSVYNLKQDYFDEVDIDWTDANDYRDDPRDYMESIVKNLESINELLLPSPDHISRSIDSL